ncbi:MAG: Wzt carbohydrate-binding domain-containing protein, partial [Burkholderiaceae bacterium]|nr:Wzt carbohydrate-binding domain-containing protein [Burkholderiaceae bacterium]
EDEAAKSEGAQVPARAPNAGAGRWGTGEVEITDVEFLDASGAVRRVFLTGAEMNIRIRYRAAKRVVDPIFGLAIHSQQGAHLCGPNTMFSGAPIEYVEGEGAVTYRIANLPLLEGGYVVSVASHNREDSKMYAYHDRLYPFQVYPGASRERYGLVSMNGEWEIRTDDGEAAY